MKNQVEPSHYFKPSYDTKKRFISYWHQITELIQLKPSSILEIGIGNSLVSNYLKQRGYNVTTMDIDPCLNPDIVASIDRIPFTDESFDVVACFEVLEHLPYEKFTISLKELHRVSRRYVVLSLPDATLAYPLYIYIPKLRRDTKTYSITMAQNAKACVRWSTLLGDRKVRLRLKTDNRRYKKSWILHHEDISYL